MTKPAISRFPVPDLDALPDDLKTMFRTVQDRAGLIPNVFLTLAHRPDEWRAFFAYPDALMPCDGNLSQAEKEMVIIATSNGNGCQYCVVAHGAILRIRAKNPLIADQIAVNYRKADLSARQRAMLDFAMKVSEISRALSDEDFDGLHAHGFDDEDIWDIAGITAFFGPSNHMANFISRRPNEEFFTMGR